MAITTHGHHIPGTLYDEEDYGEYRIVACGGVTKCSQCEYDVEAAFDSGTSVFVPLDTVQQNEALAILFGFFVGAGTVIATVLGVLLVKKVRR